MLKRCAHVALLIYISILAGCAEVVRSQIPEYDPAVISDNAWIGDLSFGSPLGTFMLVETHGVRCAIMFYNPERRHDQRAASVFTSGAETVSAHFVSFSYLPQYSTDTIANAPKASGTVSNGASYGFGRIVSFGPSIKPRVPCGNIEISWTYPHRLSAWIYVKDQAETQYDYSMKFAPTSIRKPEIVDFSNPALIWYQVSRTPDYFAPPRLIPIAQLPH